MLALAAILYDTRSILFMRGHIDRLRGTFALCVMLGHAMDFASASRPLPDVWFGMFSQFRALLGFQWVVGFIILSGYCIARSCMTRGTTLSPRHYATLRISRIFPLLWAALAIAVVIELSIAGHAARPDIWTNIDFSAGAIILNAIGLGGFYGPFGSLAPSYTLSFELLFYAAWAAVWFTDLQRRRLWLRAAATIAAIALLGLLPLPFGTPFRPFVLLLYVCWLIGAAVAFYGPTIARWPVVRAAAPLRWFGVVIVLVLGWERAMPIFSVTARSIPYYLGLSLAFAFVLIGYESRDAARPAHRLDGVLGLMSYPLFVVHGPVLMFVTTRLRELDVSVTYARFMLLTCLPAIAAAALLAVLVERPVMALRESWRPRVVVPTSPGSLSAESIPSGLGAR
jgi:peptidoglycan/LPS O-acetylase OafA/YrhL